MAVNLIEAFGQRRSREVLETSFAQFQADRSVVGLARGIREKQASLDGYEESMRCHVGDFREYARLRRQVSDLEREIAQSGRQARRNDLRQTKGMRQLDIRVTNLKRELRSHPCHACPDREVHSRWGERWYKLERETAAIIKQIESRTNQVAKTFDRITEVLIELEYVSEVSGDLEITESGQKLAKIYGERDLLVAECIGRRIWHHVDAQTLAAIAASLVYEARRDDDSLTPKMPKGEFVAVFNETLEVWDDLQALAKAHNLPLSSEPDSAMALQMHRWATGSRLDSVMKQTGMLAGDFIRWCKQTIDLLEQISKVNPDELSATAQSSIDQIKRGIVAYSYYA
jgi:ATP-dependent RNA helicase HelY